MTRYLDTLDSIRRDLAHAARSLVRDRAFTFVCVISLGIGMGALVALVTFNRAITAPAHGIETNALTELLVLPQGPLRAKAGVWALEPWSYPDYQALRRAEIGVDVTGWVKESGPNSASRVQTKRRRPPGGDALRLGELLPHIWGIARARRGPGFESYHRRCAFGGGARRLEPQPVEDASLVQGRHRDVRPPPPDEPPSDSDSAAAASSSSLPPRWPARVVVDPSSDDEVVVALDVVVVPPGRGARMRRRGRRRPGAGATAACRDGRRGALARRRRGG